MSVERILSDLKSMQEANEYLKSQVRVMKEIIKNAGEARGVFHSNNVRMYGEDKNEN